MTALVTRERITTAIACALIRSQSQSDPVYRVAADQIADVSSKIADQIIDNCNRDHAAHMKARQP